MSGHLQPLLKAAGGSLTGERLLEVRRAFEVADRWHSGQFRRDGSPYITHSVAVAVILAELGSDHEMLCAALLHDVSADAASREEAFGEPISNLLRGMRKLDSAQRRPPDWPASTDERVLMLKLADRLHNQRTIRGLPEARQRVNSQENLDVVAPVARRLGLTEVEAELRRLAMANLSGLGGAQACFGVITAGAIMLPADVRGRWLEEWLGELLALPGGRARLTFVFWLMAGMPRMALTLRRRDALGRRGGGGAAAAGRAVVRCLRWVVRSDLRTWALLTPLLAWLVLDAAAERLADAVVIAITVPPVLVAAVRAIRARLGGGDGRG
ncbi:HD domain-containing protein [Nonomuraea sp. PA05]|uniref:HD domain-containing protein n=1 Tax=Nonomuraea sp. PA05 TaxID=2604466 RepID=UPI001652AD79|nr:HD domain-containing protein [Nonomuraea sp. PA05]